MSFQSNSEERIDPEALLKSIKKQEADSKAGKLKIFFGMSAGVGKTYAMLEDAQERQKEGIDIVIGLITTHGRKDTEELTKNLPIIPEKIVDYKGSSFKELDIDAILKRRPSIVLVDELAHTNVPGSRHHKRWQDVLEILDAGIDVYSTLNVQHIESRKDVVEEITGISIRETVPDSIVERASQIELVDITPDELLKRLKEGKVYIGPQSELAAKNFFQKDRLTALREIALRLTAEKVDHDLHTLIPTSESTTSWKTSERLLVAVSHSPRSQSLIRTCRRYAFRFDAPWIALHVDNGKKLNAKESEQLVKNLGLARELGAEVVTIVDPDISKAIQRTAQKNHVTQILIGRPEKKFFKNLFGSTSLLDDLKDESSTIDIHIIRNDGMTLKKSPSLFPLEFTSPTKDYWWTIIYILIISLLCNMSSFDHEVIGCIFLISLIFLSLIVSFGPLILGAGLSALIWYFNFLASKEDFGGLETGLVLAFFSAAVVLGILSEKVKERERLLRLREEKTQALYDIVQEIAKAPTIQDLFSAVSDKINTLIGGSTEIITKANGKGLVFNNKSILVTDDKEKAVATWSLEQKTQAGLSTDTLASSSNLYIPLKAKKQAVGVLIFRPEVGHSVLPDEVNLLQTIAQQLAFFIERIENEDKTRRAEYAAQVEKIQHAIINSISGELYNPLKEITGAAQDLKKVESTKSNLFEVRKIEQIEESSNTLSRIVDNVLAMSKLNSGFFKIQKQEYHIKELIDACLLNMKKHLENHVVQEDIADNIPNLTFDFALMELLLCNLLINAAEYSEPGKHITVGARSIGSFVLLSVCDEGSGIPEDHLALVFQKFYRLPGTTPSGAGLGLSLVKTIADIHKAKIEVHNRKDGGVEFTLYLPK